MRKLKQTADVFAWFYIAQNHQKPPNRGARQCLVAFPLHFSKISWLLSGCAAKSSPSRGPEPRGAENWAKTERFLEKNLFVLKNMFSNLKRSMDYRCVYIFKASMPINRFCVSTDAKPMLSGVTWKTLRLRCPCRWFHASRSYDSGCDIRSLATKMTGQKRILVISCFGMITVPPLLISFVVLIL